MRDCSLQGANLLMHDIGYAFWGNAPGQVVIQQATLHRIRHLGNHPRLQLSLTNCLLAAVTNLSSFSGAGVAVVEGDKQVFEEIPGGSHYLPRQSPFRNAGTPHIEPLLKDELQRLTTEAPMLLDGEITIDQTLGPQIRPGSDIPDLGYHYEVVDYALMGVTLQGAQLSLVNGCTLGLASDNKGRPGITVGPSAMLNSHGRAERLNRILPLHNVWEKSPSPSQNQVMFQWNASVSSPPPTAQFHFTSFNQMAADSLWNAAPNSLAPGEWTLRDCQITGGNIEGPDRSSNDLAVWSNNLFQNAALSFDSNQPFTIQFWNNTFINGLFQLGGPSGSYHFRDNFFNGTVLAQEAPVDHDYNAYRANAPRWAPEAPHDQILESTASSRDYAPGTLGPYYVPSDGSPLRALLDSGSRTASEAGLYHHTLRVTDLPEYEGPVDIGFHYIAYKPGEAGKQAYDTDQDGLADYEEDLNGNGLFDPERFESNWLTSLSDPGLPPRSISLKLFTPLL
jgi:hypothetical protein